MDKARHIYYFLRHVYREIQRIKTWQLLIILVLVGFVAATFLRLNNVEMDQRRASLLLADEEGRDEDMYDRMYDLQHYVAKHMNTSTGQFDLTEQYKRDVQKAIDASANDENPHGIVTARVREVCDPQFAAWSQAYVQCFIDELNKFPSAPSVEEMVRLPPPALYRHSFAAPLWSPDFAGFSVLVFLFIVLIIIGRWLHFAFLTLLLKLRRRGIGS